jgi:hypothetical protein
MRGRKHQTPRAETGSRHPATSPRTCGTVAHVNRSTLLLWLLLSCAVACSRKTELNTLGLQYEPPSGMALRAEEPGPPAVARYEFQQGTSRTLVYFLPLADRSVLVLYTAPERDYGPGSARVERSLSTLRPTR